MHNARRTRHGSRDSRAESRADSIEFRQSAGARRSRRGHATRMPATGRLASGRSCRAGVARDSLVVSQKSGLRTCDGELAHGSRARRRRQQQHVCHRRRKRSRLRCRWPQLPRARTGEMWPATRGVCWRKSCSNGTCASGFARGFASGSGEGVARKCQRSWAPRHAALLLIRERSRAGRPAEWWAGHREREHAMERTQECVLLRVAGANERAPEVPSPSTTHPVAHELTLCMYGDHPDNSPYG